MRYMVQTRGFVGNRYSEWNSNQVDDVVFRSREAAASFMESLKRDPEWMFCQFRLVVDTGDGKFVSESSLRRGKGTKYYFSLPVREDAHE